tara:strand:- start:2285 stop:2425 length:141 start_codon:yes stop_codon:yes gene_type:complete
METEKVQEGVKPNLILLYIGLSIIGVLAIDAVVIYYNYVGQGLITY